MGMDLCQLGIGEMLGTDLLDIAATPSRRSCWCSSMSVVASRQPVV